MAEHDDDAQTSSLSDDHDRKLIGNHLASLSDMELRAALIRRLGEFGRSLDDQSTMVWATGLLALPEDLLRRVCPPVRIFVLRRVCRKLRHTVRQCQAVCQVRHFLDYNAMLVCSLQTLAKKCLITTLDLTCDSKAIEDGQDLGAVLGVLTSLTTLNLSMITCENDASVLLDQPWGRYRQAKIERLTRLTSLNLESHDLGGIYGMMNLAPALGSLTLLTDLNLSRTDIGDDGAKKFAQALHSLTRMAVLDLSGNHDIGHEGFTHLATALRCCTSMRTLRLGCKSFGDTAASQIASSIGSMTSITEIDLTGSSIQDAGCSSLAETLRNSTSLVHLCLGGLRHSGLDGVQHLARALRSCTSIKLLDLDSSFLGDPGVAEIGRAMRSMPSITKLCLSSNVISDEGCSSLAEGLRNKTSLRHLKLDHNMIADAGVTRLAASLRLSTHSLQNLDLSNNVIEDEGADALGPALSKAGMLCEVNLEGNMIEYLALLRLKGSLSHLTPHPIFRGHYTQSFKV